MTTTTRARIRLPWCGHCDERTRLIELPDGRPQRCQACGGQRPAGGQWASLTPATASDLQLRQMRERDLQAIVISICSWLHLDWFHPLNSRGMNPGWPDLVIIGSKVIYRELKTEIGGVSPAQKRVGERLTKAGADWDVWRPRDLRSGAIERQLRAALNYHPPED